MSSDPTSDIQAVLAKYENHFVNQHVAVVAGIISPDVVGSPTLLFAGAENLWNSQHELMSLDDNTLFEIGSITKVFTALVVLNKLGSTLGQWITAEDYPLPARLSSSSLLDIATYSPGFPTDNKGGCWPAGTTSSLLNLLEFLSKNPGLPPNLPGTCYSYSNFGWSLLALAGIGVNSSSDHVIDEWSKLLKQVREYIGLSTSTAQYDKSMIPNLPVGHAKDGTIFPVGTNYAPTPHMLFGAGGLVSTGNDMLKWLEFNMGLLNPNYWPLLAQMQQQTEQRSQCPPSTKTNRPTVSLGWFHDAVTTGDEQVIYLAKDGGVGGFTSWMGFPSWVETNTPSQIGCFVLTNSHGAAGLGRQILNILLGNLNPVGISDEVDYVTPPEAE